MPQPAERRPREEGYSGSDEDDDMGGYIPKKGRVGPLMGARLSTGTSAAKADAVIQAVVDKQRGEVKNLDYATASGAHNMIDLDEQREQELELPDDTDFEGDQAVRAAALAKRAAVRAALLESREVRFIWEK